MIHQKTFFIDFPCHFLKLFWKKIISGSVFGVGGGVVRGLSWTHVSYTYLPTRCIFATAYLLQMGKNKPTAWRDCSPWLKHICGSKDAFFIECATHFFLRHPYIPTIVKMREYADLLLVKPENKIFNERKFLSELWQYVSSCWLYIQLIWTYFAEFPLNWKEIGRLCSFFPERSLSPPLMNFEDSFQAISYNMVHEFTKFLKRRW